MIRSSTLVTPGVEHATRCDRRLRQRCVQNLTKSSQPSVVGPQGAAMTAVTLLKSFGGRGVLLHVVCAERLGRQMQVLNNVDIQLAINAPAGSAIPAATNRFV